MDITVRSDPTTLTAVWMGDLGLAAALSGRAIELEGPKSIDGGLAGRLNDAPQTRPIDLDQGIAEVEGDRLDGRDVHGRQVATLEGQISRNGQ